MSKYLAEGDGKGLTTIVLQEGNKAEPYIHGIKLQSLERDVLNYAAGHQPGHHSVSHDGLTFIANKDGKTGLGPAFEGMPVWAQIVRHSLIFKETKDSEKGLLLEPGDALLVSNVTKRDLITGAETYQVAAVSSQDFDQHFIPYAGYGFRPSTNPQISPYGAKIGAPKTAPFVEQLQAIADWPPKDFEDHHKHIVEDLKRKFSSKLEDAYKESLQAGGDYNTFDNIFDETALSLAKGCTDSLGEKSGYSTHQLAIFRDLMKQDGVEKTLRETHGDKHVDKLAADWANHSLARGQASSYAYSLNPAALSQEVIKTGKPISAAQHFDRAAGGNKTLYDALGRAFQGPCVEAYRKAAQESPLAKVPLVGQRIVDSAVASFAKVFE